MMLHRFILPLVALTLFSSEGGVGRWAATAVAAPGGGLTVSAVLLQAIHNNPERPAPVPDLLSLGRPMPPKPLAGQRKPPCERGETAINGACWWEIAREKPPCGETMFDHDGHCYKAGVDMPRPPTSEDPR